MDNQLLKKMFVRCQYITLARACEYLGISTKTFRRYVDYGVISTVKQLPSGHYRLDKTTIERIEQELIEARLFGEVVDQNQQELPFLSEPDKSEPNKSESDKSEADKSVK